MWKSSGSYSLSKDYHVTVYDTLYFTDEFLPRDHPNLEIVKGDIRDADKFKYAVTGHDVVISLACISNDASFELDENLSTSINLDAFEPMVKAAKQQRVKRFIYASSSSVYGISDSPNVTEEHPLVPLTLYNKYKGLCEPILNNHGSDDFIVTTFRPATVCGYAPRLRLDLSVNILTNHAIVKDKITVFGGDQLRPNLHVKDYVRVCELLINAPASKIHKNVFNVGYQNKSIKSLADIVKSQVLKNFTEKEDISIVFTPSDDNRSYHINSDKIKEHLGFEPLYTIEDAVESICLAYREGRILNSFDNDIFYNIRTMKGLKVS